MKKLLICVIFSMIADYGCKRIEPVSPALDGQDLSKVLNELSVVMVHDVTNPPLAARFFAYACLSGYEVVAENDPHIHSMYSKLNGYPNMKKPENINGYDYRLSALLAVMATAQKIQPSGFLVEKFEKAFLDSCRKVGFSQIVVDQSAIYANLISAQVLSYAKTDGYNKLSNFKRYSPIHAPGKWDATPPAFMAAVEPHFYDIRPFTLNSSSQFRTAPPVPFSTNHKSVFYKQMQMCYLKSGPNLSDEERIIAGFWDCNPFAVENDGHMLIGIKKISPGAHWLGITAIACKKAKFSFSNTMKVSTMVSIGLMDSFMCCWDEKYLYNRLRPETAIRTYIDPSWKPLLQTPPFPEYLSGHSCVSATSAVILSHYFGDHFEYLDNVEENFGLSPRKFTSFKGAAKEAGISRFYGGIHFMDAINNGLKQGEQVGQWIINKVE